ncbi:MAG: HPF/RaiA family ribosome-associated protein [Desulfobulbaceae bacterium]|jgi:ribosomal subunit interface protein|nr:HPF/RaiA family ribosome-associated protein [Desulfobulbaceae bacterium]
MQLPLQITYRNMDSSAAVEADIQGRVDKLEEINSEIISCKVVLEAPAKSQQQGGLFKVSIDLSCPEGKVVVNKEPSGKNKAHEDCYVALRDAFRAAGRQLEKYSERRRGEVKTHAETPFGQISYLAPMEDYGMITTPDSREIYFHRNSVHNADFDSLAVGTQVTFNEEEGDKGPQANVVKIKG